ncbi:PREDICTED: uncharacterized protein LOC108760996, partial [Trachymyrmex cornetzi]|uniref:uncharacterized protein LOC108760996 n=1 Tax=Trachymyrmex cornetzi TaxID=471704 RepID=UPI00084F1333
MTKRAVINVRSMDNACFAWFVIAALYPAKRNADRESSYPHYTTVLNFQNIEFPITLKDVTQFERLNDVSINVYVIEGQNTLNVLPIRLIDDKKEKHVDLLYLRDPRDDNVGHFAWIKNLSRLMSKQLNKHNGQKYICDHCLHYFHSNERLQLHIVDCQRINECAIRLPSNDDKWLSFNNYNRKERVPFVVYADLECILEKTDGDQEASTLTYHHHHQVFSIGYYVRCSYDNSLSKYRFHRDPDCVSWFVEELRSLAHSVKKILVANVPMETLSSEQRETLHSATHCHVCEKPFAPDDNRVRDHCHLTGRYRGPAHSNCNLNYKNSYFIPIVFHNLSGYDSHFVIKEVATVYEGSIELLPITKEKYISFTKNVKDTAERSDSRNNIKLRFIDSYKFLSSSLDKLASFLNKNELRILQCEFQNLSEDDFKLLIRKGIFPYEYIDCADKLQDTHLPSRESFYSSLTGDTVSENDYAHAVNVWQQFYVQTLGEYSDLYLKTDVLLLADIFENFRDKCYVLEVDLEYPERLHDEHVDLPFCPTRDKPPGKQQDKLLATSPWLRDYIELNTKFRTLAKNDFEKNLFKLMNNAVFGKTMENVRNHIDVKLLTQWDGRYGAEAMIAKPNFHSRSVFSENLIAIEIRKLEVKFNKPIYVGMCILDISKVYLYEFHHEYILPLYRKKCEIMYTDTDSLIYRIECDDVYEQMKRDIIRFDTSDYSTDNVYGIPLANKKVPGLMKDENNGAILTEFVGLRAKMYALRVDGKKDTKKAKGVKSNIVARTITFDDYTRCLNDEIEMTRQQSCIRSKLHQVYTISETKIALSPYEDKRYIIPNST